MAPKRTEEAKSPQHVMKVVGHSSPSLAAVFQVPTNSVWSLYSFYKYGSQNNKRMYSLCN